MTLKELNLLRRLKVNTKGTDQDLIDNILNYARKPLVRIYVLKDKVTHAYAAMSCRNSGIWKD
jgi:hypothetical protein